MKKPTWHASKLIKTVNLHSKYIYIKCRCLWTILKQLLSEFKEVCEGWYDAQLVPFRG